MNIDTRIEMVLRICKTVLSTSTYYLLKSVFSEIQSQRTWLQVVFSLKTGLQLVDLSGLPIKGLLFWWGNHLNSCPDSYLRKNWLKKICLQKYILYVLSECIIYGLWVYSYIYEYILGPHTLHCILNQFSIWYLWLQHVANQREL